MKCPDCGQAFGTKGLAVHRGRKHAPPRCRWVDENRGWCVTHDSEWRIDRVRCETDILASSIGVWRAKARALAGGSDGD